MATRHIRENVSVGKKNADGSYPVVVITEGEGSSGSYSADLLERSEHVFSGVPSFMNHPKDAGKPHERDVMTIAGRIGEVRVDEDNGRRALVSTFTPRKEFETFFEQFWDVLGLSIYCGASGEELPDGRLKVTEFDATDPYRSVDVVVAAGRGGRFQAAMESYRAIESSLGTPADPPGVTSASKEKEKAMDKEILEALTAIKDALAPIAAFVNESKTAQDAQAQAKVDAEAVEAAVKSALDSYEEKVAAIEAAELLEPQAKQIRALAREGKDVSADIASAKEVKEAAIEAAKSNGYIAEGAKDEDFTVSMWGGK